MEKVPENREYFSAAITPETINPENRTVDCIWFTGIDVPRFGFAGRYVRRFDPKGVDLSSLNSGAPVFDNHNDYDGAAGQMGKVERAWTDGAVYKATLRFSKRPEVAGLWQDIQDRIVTKFSMGTEILAEKEEKPEGSLPVRIATKWRPFEISVAPLPADFATTTLSADRQGENMIETEKTESLRVKQITERVKAAKLPAEFATELIGSGKSADEASTAIFEKLAEISAKEQPEIRTKHTAGVTRDYTDGLVARMSEAVAARYTGKQPSDGAREYMGASIADLAFEITRANGLQPLNRWNRTEVIRLAHTTSDFPQLLQGAGQRMLLTAYQAAQSPILQIARRSTANDFRAKSVLRLGETPKLLKVNEAGEITYGSRAEVAEAYRIFTYARLFSITREALVNDDLGAFGDFARAYGVSAASAEAQLLVDTLYGAAGSGAVMQDGKAMFHADHANLASSGAGISETTLTAARLALRTTKGLDGETIIEVAPRYLVAPAAMETDAQKALAAIYPASTSDVNPFTNALTLITDPRLDAKSAARWYVFGDPGVAPVLEYSYLAGSEGVQVDTRAGWEVLGIEFRAVLDFGAGAIGYRGAYSNPGV